MRKKIYLILSCVLYMSFFSCTSKKTNTLNGTSIAVDTVKIFVRDTIYITDSCLFPDHIYLYVNYITNSRVWGSDDIYRIVFTSVEEMRSIYLEKFQIMESDGLKFIERTKIPPEIFEDEFNYYAYHPKIIEWVSPTVAKLLINEKEYNLDISKMKVVE